MALRSCLTKLACTTLAGSLGAFWIFSDWPRRATYGPYACERKLASKMYACLPDEVKSQVEELIRKARSTRLPSKGDIIAKMPDADQVTTTALQVAKKLWNLTYVALEGVFNFVVKIDHAQTALIKMVDEGILEDMAIETLEKAKELGLKIEFEINDVTSDATQDAEYCLFYIDQLADEWCLEVERGLQQLDLMLQRAEHEAEQTVNEVVSEIISQVDEFISQVQERIQEKQQVVLAKLNEAEVAVHGRATRRQRSRIEFAKKRLQVALNAAQHLNQVLLTAPEKLRLRITRATEEVTNWPVYLEFVHNARQVSEDILQKLVETIDSTEQGARNFAEEVGIDLEAIHYVVMLLPNAVCGVASDAKAIAVDFVAERAPIEEHIANIEEIIATSRAIAIAFVIEVDRLAESGVLGVVKLARKVADAAENEKRHCMTFPDRLQQRVDKIRFELQEGYQYLRVTVPPAVDSVKSTVNEAARAAKQMPQQVQQTVDRIPELLDELLDDAAQVAADSPEMIYEAVTTLVEDTPFVVKSVTDEVNQIASELVQNYPVVAAATEDARKVAVFSVKLGEKVTRRVGESARKVAVAAVHEVFAPVVSSVTLVLSMPATLVTSVGDRVLTTIEEKSDDSSADMADEEPTAPGGDNEPIDWSEGPTEDDELRAIEVEEDPAIDWPYSSDVEEWSPAPMGE